MIKKQIYFYWGEQPMSFLRYMTIKSFSYFNPDWKIILIKNHKTANNTWTSPEEQDNNNYRGYNHEPELHEIQNFEILDLDSVLPFDYQNMSNVHIKDILNWYLLSTRSCAVADMDIIFCSPIESGNGIDWNAHVNICQYDFFMNYKPISFMLSDVIDGKNDFYEFVYNKSRKAYIPSVYESCGTGCITYSTINDIKAAYPELQINKMDHMTVFPFAQPHPGNSAHHCWDDDFTHLLNNNTIGVHWFGGQPPSQHNNGIITRNNVYQFNNTIANLIKRIV